MEITLKDFTSVSDIEKSKYLLLNKLKFCEKELNESKLYPTYQMLINVYQQLVDVLENHSLIYNREYTDILNETDEAEKQKLVNSGLEQSFELMHWAFKYISKSLETGRAIYDFVNDNINIESIGIKSDYNQEGYFVIPDNTERLLRIIKYQKNLHKILKTREVGNFQLNIVVIPNESIKNHIIADDILNQIVYYLETELTFPFRETILPIAKRKFLNYLEK